MRFVKLTMCNFRHHVYTEIEFKDGLTAIVGPNGSGKTTILEAITWALFGSRGARTKVDDLINDRRARNDLTWVKFEFEIERAGTEVTYTVSREPGGASIALNGTPFTEGATATTEYIEEHVLGMTYEEWCNSVFTEQKGVDWMAGKGKAERERFLSQMLGYGRLRDAQKQARERGRDIGSQITAHEGMIGDQTPEGLDAVVERRVLEQSEAEAEAETTAARVTSLRVEQDELTVSLDALRKAEAEIEKVAAKISTLETLGHQLQNRVDDGTAWLKKSGSLEELQAALGVAATEKASLLDDAERARVSGEHCAVVVVQVGVRFDETEPLLAETLKKIEPLHDRMTYLSAQITDMEGLGDAHSCPTCQRELDDSFDVVLDRIRAERDGIKPDLESLMAGKAGVEEVRMKLSRERIDNDVSATRFLADSTAYIVRASAFDGTIARYEKDIGQWDAATEKLDALAVEIAENHKALGVARDANAKLGSWDPEAIGTREQRLRAVGSGLRQALSKQADDQAMIATKEAAVGTAKREVERLEESMQAIAALRAETVTVEATARMFGDLRSYLNEQIRPDVSTFATELVSEMSNGAFDELVLDDNYIPRPYREGRAVKLTSGGEADVCSLAVRLAVSRIVAERSGTPVDVVVLDEVFAHLDRDRRKLLVSTIQGLTETRFRQVLMVTHDAEVTNLVDQIINVGLDSDGCAEVSFADASGAR